MGLRLVGTIAFVLVSTGCSADPCTWRIAGDTGVSMVEKRRLSATVCLSSKSKESLFTNCGSATTDTPGGAALEGPLAGQLGVHSPVLVDGTKDNWQYWIVFDAAPFQTPFFASVELHDGDTSELLVRAAWTEEEACTDWNLTLDVGPREGAGGGGGANP